MPNKYRRLEGIGTDDPVIHSFLHNELPNPGNHLTGNHYYQGWRVVRSRKPDGQSCLANELRAGETSTNC